MRVFISKKELVRLSCVSKFKILNFEQIGLKEPTQLQIDNDGIYVCEIVDEPLFMLKVIEYGIKHEAITN